MTKVILEKPKYDLMEKLLKDYEAEILKKD
jgi:hypothetical protein